MLTSMIEIRFSVASIELVFFKSLDEPLLPLLPLLLLLVLVLVLVVAVVVAVVVVVIVLIEIRFFRSIITCFDRTRLFTILATIQILHAIMIKNGICV